MVCANMFNMQSSEPLNSGGATDDLFPRELIGTQNHWATMAQITKTPLVLRCSLY